MESFYLLQGSHDAVTPPESSNATGDVSPPWGRSLSMPLSLDMTEKRLLSGGIGSRGESPSSGSSCSGLREICSDEELDRSHLATSHPVDFHTVNKEYGEDGMGFLFLKGGWGAQ